MGLVNLPANKDIPEYATVVYVGYFLVPWASKTNHFNIPAEDFRLCLDKASGGRGRVRAHTCVEGSELLRTVFGDESGDYLLRPSENSSAVLSKNEVPVALVEHVLLIPDTRVAGPSPFVHDIWVHSYVEDLNIRDATTCWYTACKARVFVTKISI